MIKTNKRLVGLWLLSTIGLGVVTSKAGALEARAYQEVYRGTYTYTASDPSLNLIIDWNGMTWTQDNSNGFARPVATQVEGIKYRYSSIELHSSSDFNSPTIATITISENPTVQNNMVTTFIGTVPSVSGNLNLPVNTPLTFTKPVVNTY